MIHETAIVETDRIGPGSNIWAYAHVMPNAVVGANTNVGDHSFIEGGAVIGDRVTIKNNVSIWDGVTIEAGVFVGPSVIFSNDKHPRSPRLETAKQRYATRDWLSPVRVREGCSIGAGATICPGVELGEYAMIGAGAVVTKSVSPFGLVVGCPARHVGDVCVCGQKLSGGYDKTDCNGCGQTAAARVEKLAQLRNLEAKVK